MATILTYDNLTLDSTEILSVDIESGFDISTNNTVNDKQLTQPGNITPIILQLTARFTNNAADKMRLWRDKPRFKPIFDLNFLGGTWGGYYLNSVSITSNSFDELGDILTCDIKVTFTQNQNFF